jgi:hypothetical protein
VTLSTTVTATMAAAVSTTITSAVAAAGASSTCTATTTGASSSAATLGLGGSERDRAVMQIDGHRGESKDGHSQSKRCCSEGVYGSHGGTPCRLERPGQNELTEL